MKDTVNVPTIIMTGYDVTSNRGEVTKLALKFDVVSKFRDGTVEMFVDAINKYLIEHREDINFDPIKNEWRL